LPGRLRQPVVCVLGHVDAGKTTLLDKIRGTAVALREPGMMSQHIGASFLPYSALRTICGPLLDGFRAEVRIPGLLVIDTPGHSAFVNLRRRGGSVADIAILVVDVIRGLEVQTLESIEILRSRKTPFVVAVNKIDLLSGWRPRPSTPFLESYNGQSLSVQRDLEEHLYVVMGAFSRLGFLTDRFDRVKDFTQTLAIVPLSAKTGEGIPELLAVLVGLTQQYMEKRLTVSSGPAKGTVLEVKEEPGLGVTVNALIYDGVLREGDEIIVGGKQEPIATRVRAILLPKPMDEIRDPRDKFTPVKEVAAAAGVKIGAPRLDDAMAGSPIYATSPDQTGEELIKVVSEEIEKIRIQTDKMGLILKTDTLGSLEAIVTELEGHGFPIRLADIGDVSKRDVVEASVVMAKEPLLGAILAFGVRTLPDAAEEARSRGVRIFENQIIYQLIEDYDQWMRKEKERITTARLSELTRLGKIRVIPGLVFRMSKPAIFGVEILAGFIRPGEILMRSDGTDLGEVMQVQDKGQAIPEASAGMKVAISVREPIFGRHVHENDTLYVKIPERDFKLLMSKFQGDLSEGELKTAEEVVEVMRRENPSWGM